jgi:uncharacterized protein
VSERAIPGIVAAGLLFALASVLATAQESRPAASGIGVLLLTGQNNHDWPWTSAKVREILERTGRFRVTISEDPRSALADPEALRAADLFFLNWNGERWGEAAESAFANAVRQGKGVFVLHAANNAFAGWKEYEEIIGLAWRAGSGHGRYHTFDVQVVDRDHPVTHDLPDIEAHPDELYHGLVRTSATAPRVLMSAHSAESTGGSGRREPMAMVSSYGTGRIFHTPLGHVWPGAEDTRPTFADPQLALLIARGAEWAATGEVTIAPSMFGLEARAATSRPRDPFVFRSVLDARTRILTAALASDLWVAYDTETCGLYKAWPGGVDLQGAVFTGEHGPQPTSKGGAYVERAAKPELSLAVARARAPRSTLIHSERGGFAFGGHRIDRGSLTLLWSRPNAPDDGPEKIVVEETVERCADAELMAALDPIDDHLRARLGEPHVTLRRTFVIAGLPPRHALDLEIDMSETVVRMGAAAPLPSAFGMRLSPAAATLGNGRTDVYFVMRRPEEKR